MGIAGLGVAGVSGIGAVKAAQAEANVIVRRPFLSERIFDTRRRSYLPAEVNRLMHNKALDQRVVCIGEVHNDDAQHYAEYSILQAVHKRRGATGLNVGLEMFYRQHQAILDDYVFGKGTLASLKEDTKWDKTWGHKMASYAKIFQYAKAHGIRLCGLNVPQPVVQVVRQMGLEHIPEELRRRLPAVVDLSNTAHRDDFLATMRYFASFHGGAKGGGIPEEALERLYEAQTLWDEYMAESAARLLEADPRSRMIVLAGTNHIQNRYGVPDRIMRRLGGQPVFTILPVSVKFDAVTSLPMIGDGESYDTRLGDWVYFIEKA
ncbi:hypothetical protein NSK_000962 [Nannochloropsis salina CCMP1776]|uniref:Haem-binding uptake Tiki superfamily ChaN domain-containing protein n=1 Tax=Nannochloropsis salina CCMP1776 TaxID=1027361 RepID=A0A4D9D7B7_9STRA|nr:hypothetical protein NSK_000962 [Nannochloropsis salina CCMP1776]|eukprot:TFJ87611.1 hypothetical protein NSK_000962 [Nannochloropsis salina CCMP1776]